MPRQPRRLARNAYAGSYPHRVRSIRRLSTTALVATLALVTIGGYTRGSGSGYGCKDRWPLCEDGLLGGLLPRADYHMIIEWTHRWVAAVVGLLAIATAVTAWRRHRRDTAIVIPSVAAVFVIGVQAWVGRLVVKGDLDADLVSVHLAISMAVVALLTMVVVATLASEGTTRIAERDIAWTRAVAIGAVGAVAVLLLGSYVHNIYIPGWPLVSNDLIPDLSNRFIAVHYFHRVLALAGFVYAGYLAVAANRHRRPDAERWLIYGAGAAYTVNIGVGAAHVFTKVGSSVLVAGHLLLAAIAWTCLVAATAMSLRAVASSSPSVRESQSSGGTS